MKHKPAAAWIASGSALTILAVMMLFTSAYSGMTYVQRAYSGGPHPGVVFAWIGWVGLAVGLVTLSIGIYRHVDRIDYPNS